MRARTGRGSRTRGRVTLGLAVGALLLAGCGSGTPDAPGTTRPTAGAATSAPAGGVESADPLVPEDPDAVEEAAPGDGGGIAIEVAGLPVGSSTPLDQDGTWCFPLSWSDVTAAGAVVEIHTVRVGEPGGTVLDEPCDGRPPCAGARLVDGAGSCSLLVRPPSPEVTHVLVALDATVRCTERAACDAVRGSDGWTWLDAPAGAAPCEEGPSGTGDGSDGGTEGGTWTDGGGTDGGATPGDGADEDGTGGPGAEG